jgi:hypothetical protein
MIDKKQNMGLPTRFSLESGKFAMNGGKEKVDDNVKMFLAFVDWFRFFKQDYIIDAHRFIQNTSTFLYRYKNIFKLKTLSAGRKYVPFAEIYAVDMPMNFADRKEANIFIEYRYRLDGTREQQTIKKVVLQ